MRAATERRSAKDVRILVVDGETGAMRVASSSELHVQFRAGDLVVVNDAATLPASLAARTDGGEVVELRLASATSDRAWTAAIFGAGDYHTRTEDRPPPPRLVAGDVLRLGESLIASVTALRPDTSRLVEIELAIEGRAHAPLVEIWAALYRIGRPVQYAHVAAPLALWDVQNVYAARPWAVEMPSAGRAFRVGTLLALQHRGVEVARVTHAAGLSSIGDAEADALLPLPERFEVSEETWDAIGRTRARGGRVIAVGTSTVRALEGGARAAARTGVTSLLLGPSTRRAIVDAVVTGIHDVETSHFALLAAFATREVLTLALERAERERFLGHEMGDACLVWGKPRENLGTFEREAGGAGRLRPDRFPAPRPDTPG